MGEIIEFLLGEKTLAQYLGLVISGLVGLVGSVLVELYRSKKTIRARGGFIFSTWLLDNWERVCLSILFIFVGVLSTETIAEITGISLGEGKSGALTMGFFTDKLIEAIVAVKKGKKY